MCWRTTDRPLAAFGRGFLYAARGVAYCVRTQRNFRFHLVAAVYVLGLAPRFLESTAQWAVLILTVAAVLAAEALNTALEQAVDLACPRRDARAGIAKDAAAAAVLLCALGAAGVGVCLFSRPDAWRALMALWAGEWWRPALLAASVLPNVWFIFGFNRVK